MFKFKLISHDSNRLLKMLLSFQVIILFLMLYLIVFRNTKFKYFLYINKIISRFIFVFAEVDDKDHIITDRMTYLAAYKKLNRLFIDFFETDEEIRKIRVKKFHNKLQNL